MKNFKFIFIFLATSIFYGQAGLNDSSFNTYDTNVNNVSINGLSNVMFVNIVSNEVNGKILVGGLFGFYNGINRKNIVRLNIDGTLDTSFDPGTSSNGQVLDIKNSSQNIIVKGGFTSYNEIPVNNCVLLNSDGSVLNSLIGFNGTIDNYEFQQDGKIILIGNFTSYNGITAKKIARLNVDGSLDQSFNSNIGPNSTIYSVKVLNDGKIIICGEFTSYNGITAKKIARLNTDGSLDLTFNAQQSTDGPIVRLDVMSDGKLLISGDFLSYNGIFRNKFARINYNGSLDNSYNPTVDGFDNYYIQPDDKVVFTKPTYSQSDIYHSAFARINVNGSNDSGFVTGNGTDNNRRINGILFQSDGKMIVYGSFENYNGIQKILITRLNSDGTQDNTYVSTIYNLPNSNGSIKNIRSAKMLSNGNVAIGGQFRNYNFESFAFLKNNGGLYITPNSIFGFNKKVNTIALDSNDKLIVGGDFGFFNSEVRDAVTRLDSDGSIDNSFNPPINNYTTPYRFISTQIQPDGKYILAANFTYGGFGFSYSGSQVKRYHPDGTVDSSFTFAGVDKPIRASCLQQDGKLIVGGDYIRRVNSDGTIDTSYGANYWLQNVAINSLALQSDGKLIVGGSFSFTWNGSNYNRKIGRLDTNGNVDNTFYVTDINGSIDSTIIQSDGKIIIAGSFTTCNGVTKNRIARLNSDGTLDTSFDPQLGADGTIYCMAFQTDGRILIGGSFTNFNGIARNRIARLNQDGSLDLSFDPQLGANSAIYSIVIQSDGKAIIGGQFTSYNGTIRNRIARIFTDSALSTHETDNLENELIVFSNDNTITVNNNHQLLYEIKVYDLLGRLIVSKDKIFLNSTTIKNLPKGILVVSIENNDKSKINKKVIIN